MLALWTALALRFPRAWLFVVPALAPALNFSPWTGWTVFEEFDLLVLGAAAAGHARLALTPAPAPNLPRVCGLGRGPGWWLASATLLLTGLSMALGFQDAGGLRLGWFPPETGSLNSLRLAKPALLACLLAPMLVAQLREARQHTLRCIAGGMLAGLAIVSLAALWERAAYPGVWEFKRRYRTVALFWEMRVGGAAIDSYLALATPFVAWALWAARRPLHWAAAAALALLAGYACLTTFSRGLYAAVVLSSTLLILVAWSRRRRRRQAAPSGPARNWGDAMLVLATLGLVATVAKEHGAAVGGLLALVVCAIALGVRRLQPAGWRAPASLALALAFALEVLVVFGPGSFMRNRMAASEQDSESRWSHWRHGVHLLATPAQWAWGIGLGRLPAHYAREVAQGEFSGAAEWLESGGRGAVALSGPPTRDDLGGLFSLSQRIDTRSSYRLQFDGRGATGSHVYARVCQAHLLYESRCHSGLLWIAGPADAWQHQTLVLRGRSAPLEGQFPPRQSVFGISVSNPGGSVAVTNLVLTGPDGASLLRNGDFTAGLAHWLPTAIKHFVPWHIDNLLLEVLIERGVVTLVVFLALVATAISGLWRASHADPLSAVVLAALGGWLSVGLVSSVLDVPRVALLAMLTVVCGLALRRG